MSGAREPRRFTHVDKPPPPSTPLPWWIAPVPGWPRTLTIQRLIDGDECTVNLSSGQLERRPTPRPRQQ
jgi:hypothetical protein